ncbi:MAG: electron transport complex subunit RsxA [Actinobacteria bacterium RBG_19FT_COMBO_54_7]|uniref:Electron transport complex subunit RsxA n=1 Tax=Candidatus Solincola sediminis TaxID=1797199 RepID=A0A1F2WM72_9ACTN|nr:MAG: electron transport complex subunit RsxA [Candidatus Solincola sediminis]OFW58373.1 MAG: electron transport complex subunit RsxA [Candidatus Solincola sediminis]OFW65990.1 MAG: electron transport complex subunit RsxA [Actinobacteria bacterium RBG_19FT_COMBO_54_7]
MNEGWRFFLLFFGSALVANILLIRFIALCPFFGVSNSLETSLGMSISVIFVMVMASSVSWVAWNYVLEPLHVGEFLYIPTFILIIASLVQFVEMVIKKSSPPLYRAMGIYLPLITTNCAVLAAATESVKPGFFTKLNIAYSYGFIESVVYTLGVAVGFSLVLIIFAALRERLDMAPVPKYFKGIPIAFITAALFSLAFMGFAGMFSL